MRRARGLTFAALALALVAGCKARDEAPAANDKAAAAEPSGGLIDTVVETPEGGFRMGSPTAKTVLVEYGSYTCPHCAAFATEAMPEIKRMVADGALSYEFRPFARDVIDLTAVLVARCAGPAGFFPVSAQIFSAQQEWIDNATNITPADMKKIDRLEPNQQFRALARGTGLNAFAGQHGVTPGVLDKCLTDPQSIARAVAIHDQGYARYHIDATPTFLVDDKVVGAAGWAELKPLIAPKTGG